MSTEPRENPTQVQIDHTMLILAISAAVHSANALYRPASLFKCTTMPPLNLIVPSSLFLILIMTCEDTLLASSGR